MNHRPSGFYLCMAFLTLLAACAPQTNAQTVTPSLVPVSMAGPEVKTGSTLQYVDGTLLVAVPAGPFTMGAAGLDNPQHTVTLSDFWIYSTKVTNQQFAGCVQAGGCTAPDKNDDPNFGNPGNANDPVVGVTYNQASAYCTFVHARLPTEAEWEKTARGPDGNVYPWGNGAPTCDLLNFNKCVGGTTNVITYPQGQSYYHALDMEGNAFEWVSDRYDPAYYKTSPAQDPTGPDTGQYRSIRSSSYASKAEQIPAATRSFDLPANHRSDLGFRCVVEDPTYFAPFCQTVVVTGLNAPPPSSGDCPAPPTYKSEPYCLSGKSGKIITYEPYPLPPDAGLEIPPTCTHLSDNKYFCADGVPPDFSWFGAILHCHVKGTEGCVPGYHFVASSSDPSTGSCVPNAATAATSGKCIPGYTYDPAKQCCSAIPGTAGPYAPCPAGYDYWPATNTCDKFVTNFFPRFTTDACSKPKNPCVPGPNTICP